MGWAPGRTPAGEPGASARARPMSGMRRAASFDAATLPPPPPPLAYVSRKFDPPKKRREHAFAFLRQIMASRGGGAPPPPPPPLANASRKFDPPKKRRRSHVATAVAHSLTDRFALVLCGGVSLMYKSYRGTMARSPSEGGVAAQRLGISGPKDDEPCAPPD